MVVVGIQDMVELDMVVGLIVDTLAYPVNLVFRVDL